MMTIKTNHRLLLINLIGLWCLLLTRKHTDSQGLSCIITFKVYRNKNFRNGELTKQLTPSQCQSDCKNDPSCLAVDIMVANSNNTLTTCWFHANGTNLHMSFTYNGIDSYVKAIDCGDYTGIKKLWGQNGATGLKGQPGVMGPPGAIGFTGFTGRHGVSGNNGFNGSPGIPGGNGFSGVQGFPGITGSTGFYGAHGILGATGADGNTGQIGPPGPLIYLKESCDPSWIILVNLKSPGSNVTNLGVTNLIECKNLCLGTPSCVAVDYMVRLDNCWVHTSLADLDVRVNEPGTTQYVIKERCPVNQTASTSNSYTFYFGKTEVRGEIGMTGPTGQTGNNGMIGHTGSTGNVGFEGVKGATGVTGFTGHIGLPGRNGPFGSHGLPGDIGLNGNKGSTGYPGEVVYVRGSCQPQWVSVPGVNSPGATTSYLVKNNITCRNLCLAIPDCVAADFNKNGVYSQCKVHVDFSNLDSKIDGQSRTQWVVISRCLLYPNSISQNSGIYSPLLSNEDQKLDGNIRKPIKNCETSKLKSRSKTLVRVLIMTPIISITINIICFICYTFVWKKYLRK